MYKLMNAVVQNKLHPNTFEIPTKSDIAKIKIDTYVKLCFEEVGKQSERMWVLVTFADGENFNGVLHNQPVGLRSVKHGDVVKFKHYNILSAPY
ncbi:DUF2314 domain-containing protein [Cytobacillus solani]|uniref:DUF2314 domain-containing protein n=1 Tax=Cytobacillus solani TaxID=1637975 RepID=A0A0Q3SH52_9BACI|nr:DUF2314 domain-containing protein [Cytobacillus solani]KQL18804.1 hypothetical protein AN957_09615 [Cytobacillus solani]